MEHKRIMAILACILLISCVILGIYLLSLNSTIYSLPEKSVDDIVEILDNANIGIDKDIISNKKEFGTVYVCNSTEYTATVSRLLGGYDVELSFSIPDGEILILENGARLEFGTSFAFSYNLNGEVKETPDIFEISNLAAPVTTSKKEQIGEIVTSFMDQGNREFEASDKIHIETVVDNVWENSGLYYALCTRTIDGIDITGNLVICVVSGDKVVEAYGNWCFLTLGESYSSQLSDMLNILFNVKNEISAAAGDVGDAEKVTIESIDLCYSLYFYGSEGNFCLMPCWKVVTDLYGNFIYNAINGELYTNK